MVICLVLREIEKCTLEIFIICQLTMVMESYKLEIAWLRNTLHILTKITLVHLTASISF